MRILAIDTSGRSGSVALLDGGERVRPLSADEQYSRGLVPAIESLLDDASWTRAGLDALAVAVGPGAFTGLRVGIATAQGLALALGRPCVGVNTLEAWAALYPAEPQVAVALDAFRGELLLALVEDGRLRGAPSIATPEACADRLPVGALLVGEGARAYQQAIQARRPDLRFVSDAPPLAGTVARLGRAALERGASGGAAELTPLYLRAAYVSQP